MLNSFPVYFNVACVMSNLKVQLKIIQCLNSQNNNYDQHFFFMIYLEQKEATTYS